MVALAYKMYEIQLNFLNEVIHLNWMGPNSKLCLFGGIMINCDDDKTDRFLPMRFEVRTKEGSTDYFTHTFGQ